MPFPKKRRIGDRSCWSWGLRATHPFCLVGVCVLSVYWKLGTQLIGIWVDRARKRKVLNLLGEQAGHSKEELDCEGQAEFRNSPFSQQLLWNKIKVYPLQDEVIHNKLFSNTSPMRLSLIDWFWIGYFKLTTRPALLWTRTRQKKTSTPGQLLSLLFQVVTGQFLSVEQFKLITHCLLSHFCPPGQCPCPLQALG